MASVSLVAVALGHTQFALSASSPNPEFSDAVWVGHSGGVNKIDPVAGTWLSQNQGPKPAQAMAIDDRAGRLWTFSQGKLYQHDFLGKEKLVVSVPTTNTTLPVSTPPLSDTVYHKPLAEAYCTTSGGIALNTVPQETLWASASLAASPQDGSVWLALGDVLYQYSIDGLQLAKVQLPSLITDLTIDRENLRVWASTCQELRSYEYDGALQSRVPITTTQGGSAFIPQRWATAIDFDALLGRIWLLYGNVLQAYDLSGQRMLDKRLWDAPATRVRSDGKGSVWVSEGADVMHIDAAGNIKQDLHPWPWDANFGAIPGFDVNLSDQTLWASDKTQIKHFAPDGRTLHSLALPLLGSQVLQDKVFTLAVYTDVVPPELSVTSPTSEAYINSTRPSIEFGYSDIGRGVDSGSLKISANGLELPVTCQHANDTATCVPNAGLAEGSVTIGGTVKDYAGNTSPSVTRTFNIDVTPPVIRIDSPVNDSYTNAVVVVLAGSISEPASVSVNGAAIALGADQSFSLQKELVEGMNSFVFKAVDRAGNVSDMTVNLILDTKAPAEPNIALIAINEDQAGGVTVAGEAGSAEAGSRVVITNKRTGQSITVTANADGSFSAQIGALPGDQIGITIQDHAGNTSGDVLLNYVPPDPSTIATPIPSNGFTPFSSTVAFLYSGPKPVQNGVTAGAIVAARAAVLRGSVQKRDGTPLTGVAITIAGHPEYGQTVTRTDGIFDLVVNGGGVVTVTYQKSGYLPVQRQLNAAWNEYSWADPVVMIPVDPQVTVVDLADQTQSFQVAKGSAVTDSDGTRQATLLFPSGTTATMVMPDGTQQPLTQLNVRATEYTVGTEGPRTMPGTLPATSGYTYAVELSVDETTTAGAKSVTFSKPVWLYVENFLNFPVGNVVPTGWYSREQAAWIPSDNGRVIKVLSIQNGLAVLDVTGSGQPASSTALSGLGITDAERARLAQLYQTGQTLWRTPVSHFTPYDCNWPYGPSEGAEAPNQPEPVADEISENPDCEGGSIIECQNQVLRERIAIPGTPFTLNYRSDRVPGRKAAYRLDIQLSGAASVPPGLKSIELTIEVAGQRRYLEFPAAPNQRYVFTWDGKDAYGRTVPYTATANVAIGYVYGAVYSGPSAQARSFGRFGEGLLEADRDRGEFTIYQRFQRRIGIWNGEMQGLGSWTMSEHHAYDPAIKVLQRGDGTSRGADLIQNMLVLKKVAGSCNGCGGSVGDGGLAINGRLSSPMDFAWAPDGSLFIADRGNQRVRKISTDGIISTVAGTGDIGFTRSNIPATQANLNNPSSVAVSPDGSIYIANNTGNAIFKVGTDGIIRFVVNVVSPRDIVFAADGSFYVSNHYAIFHVNAQGTMRTVAGGNEIGYGGDGGPAIKANLNQPEGMALGHDGTLYIADTGNARIRAVGVDGVIRTVAGNGVHQFSGDGGMAVQASLWSPSAVEVGPDGALYIADRGLNERVRRVGIDGIIRTVAGGGTGDADGMPAAQARLATMQAVAFGPDKNLYVLHSSYIRRVASPMNAETVFGFDVAAEDGAELYRFDALGKHVATLDTFTGATKYSFAYDISGYLASIVDGDGNTTTIERSGDVPVAIVSPMGQRTALTLDGEGYLASITDPENETYRVYATAEGLLTQFVDRRGNSSNIAYDTLGRLASDANAAGGSWSLTRTDLHIGRRIDLASAEGRTKKFEVTRSVTGDENRVTVLPDGTQTSTVSRPSGSSTQTYPDGTLIDTTIAPDPRFGLQAPINGKRNIKLPSGLQYQESTTRTAVVDAAGLLQSEATATTTNGRTYNSSYEATNRQFTFTSPGNRQSIVRIDLQGRPISYQSSGLAPVSYSYDERGRLSSLTTGSGEDERVVRLSYGSDGYVSSIEDAMARTVAFTRDAIGRVLTQTLPGSRLLTYGYDESGNLTSLTPSGRAAHSFEYTPVDLQAQYDPPELSSGESTNTSYSYNLDKQLTSIGRPDDQIYDFAYDTYGRLQSIGTAPGATTYAYEPNTGRLSTISSPGGALTYSHDGFLPLSESYSGAFTGSTSWTYDTNFWVRGVGVNGQVVTYDYDNDGLPIRAGDLTLAPDAQNGLLRSTSLGQLSTTQNYNVFAELTQQVAQFNGSDVYRADFTRDKLGRITQKTEVIGGVSSTTAYDYDEAGRLSSASIVGGSSVAYSYDPNGNRTSVAGTTASYDSQDRLLTYGNASFAYTDNGELKAKTEGGVSTRYDYDVQGNLWRVELPGDVLIDYIVDGRNRRIGKKVNGTLVQGFLYQDQLRPVAELDGSGAVVSRFVYADKANVPSYMIKGAQTYRIVSDHLGSPRLVVDSATGEIIQRMDYDAFGNVTRDTNPGFQPFGFAGGIQDLHTGLVRFGARDYDPQTGRWTAKDPIRFGGGDTNLYGYTLNDPVNLIDDDGLRGGPVRPAPRGGDFFNRNTPFQTMSQHQVNRGLRDYQNMLLNREAFDRTVQEFPFSEIVPSERLQEIRDELPETPLDALMEQFETQRAAEACEGPRHRPRHQMR